MQLRRTSSTLLFFVALLAMETAWLLPSTHAQTFGSPDHVGRRRGAILGGLAGAALGVAIGDKGNNETAGALIGGAAGAVAGGVIGNQRDLNRQNYRAPVQQPYFPTPPRGVYDHHAPVYSTTTPYQPNYVPPHNQVIIDAPVTSQRFSPELGQSALVVQAMTFDDVLQLSQSGISDATIIRQIQRRGMASPLSVRDMIALYNAGVSESVLQAMQP